MPHPDIPPIRSAGTACFAIPGDIETVTGGYIYERRLLLALRASGRNVAHLRLPAGFPDPSATEMTAAIDALRAVPGHVPLILDGLVAGAIETAGLARVTAPVCAMIHHPLALEAGMPPARTKMLAAREAANLALAAHVVVPSPHTAAILRGQYGVPAEKISVAPPGFFRPVARAAPVLPPDAPPRILSVGILCQRKGHDILLDALARIADLDWTACIVGAPHDPATAAALLAQHAALGFGARVEFVGLISAAMLDARYRQASVFALATRYEGYGMVLAEALTYGLAVVSTRTGAVPDTVPGDAGILVPPDDPAAFADALRRMLTDRDLRAATGRAAARAGRALPGWQDTAAVMNRALDAIATAG